MVRLNNFFFSRRIIDLIDRFFELVAGRAP